MEPASQAEIYQAYAQIVAESRQPFFYAECAVPDTLDGRFDVLTLHLFFALKEHETSPEFCRALQECFFADMDRSLREMGVSDTGMHKRMKHMVEAFYGRVKAYENTAQDKYALAASLAHNIYRDAVIAEEKLNALVDYVWARLQKHRTF